MDTARLLRCLNDRSVRYVVIGAAAFPAHGYARATLDIDLLIDPEETNARAVREALADCGFDVTDVSVEDLKTLKVLIRQYVLEADVHPFARGAPPFPEVFGRSVKTEIAGVETRVAALDDLIAMKVAAGRPKDLEDLRALRELQARKKAR